MKRGIKLLLGLFIFLGIIKVNALELSQQEYESYNITRAYVVGDYIFDLSKHNPTLKDFLIAGQTLPKGEASIIEIKIAENLDGDLVKEYRELLESKTLDTFPSLDVKYIYHSEIMPDTPEAETKIVLGESQVSLAKPILATDEETGEIPSIVIYEDGKQNHYFVLENIMEDYLMNEELFPEESYSEDFCSDFDCFGFEIYSYSNNTYKFVEKVNIGKLRIFLILPAFPITIEENESKEFAVKIFLKTPSGELKYSDYSETFTVSGIDIDTSYELPDLNVSLNKYDYIDGRYNYKANIDFSDYCGDEYENCEPLGMIFEYINGNIVGFALQSSSINQLEINLEPNQEVNYYIDVLLPAEDGKYDDDGEASYYYSVILNENVQLISENEENWSETYKVTYELSDELKAYCENNSCTNVGVALFESYESEIYETLDTKNINEDFIVEINSHWETSVVAKVYIETTEGKVYGPSSNEITIIPTEAEE